MLYFDNLKNKNCAKSLMVKDLTQSKKKIYGVGVKTTRNL